MYNLMVVDDEEYAVLGIVKGIDWAELGIGRIFAAYGAAEAMQLLANERIDIMICDIEMPEISGLDLVRWANEHSGRTKTLFVTGHAEFSYARQAVRLDCEDFLLKPVEHAVLKQLVQQMIGTIEREQEVADKMLMYDAYRERFESQKAFYVENFWRDILENRLLPGENEWEEMCGVLGLSIDPTGQALLVFIKIEKWTEAWSARDTAIMKLAVRNTAADMLLELSDGAVVEDQDGHITVIRYSCRETDGWKDKLSQACERFIAKCREQLNCCLTCYVGSPAQAGDVAKSYRQLKEIEQHNITRYNCVVFHNDYRWDRSGAVAPPPFAVWAIMMEAGKRDELVEAILGYLERIDSEETPKELLESFCFGIIHLVYSMFHKQGMRIGDTSVSKELIREGIHASHIQHAGEWAVRIVSESIRDVHRFMNHQSAIVTGVKTYIQNHVYKDISREELAGAMNYNPDYLSRVFKKETGMILSDYIVCVRMNEAKRLIEETDELISHIAEKLGYTQLSYFSKLFKIFFGVSPRELRRPGKP